MLLRLRGLLLLMQGKYEEAREMFREAIRTFRTLEDHVDGKYAINIAGCYNYMSETITAKKYWPFPTYGELLFSVRWRRKSHVFYHGLL